MCDRVREKCAAAVERGCMDGVLAACGDGDDCNDVGLGPDGQQIVSLAPNPNAGGEQTSGAGAGPTASTVVICMIIWGVVIGCFV